MMELWSEDRSIFSCDAADINEYVVYKQCLGNIEIKLFTGQYNEEYCLEFN